MSLDELRARLERLNRSPLDERIGPASELPPPADRQRRGDGPLSLESALPGRVEAIEGSSLFLLERCVGECWAPGRGLLNRLRSAGSDARRARRRTPLHPDLADLWRGPERAWLFTDLETCGFSGTPVFLIGTMYVDDDDLRVEQLLARSYDEEVGILRRFSRVLADHPHLVTFNGKAFDWRFLADRSTVHGVELPGLIGHCDLLHVARRRFKDALPDCRLQTLERFVCGRQRVGDIPGFEIPGAYHAFVRTQDARELREIVQHNFLDLVTMAEVLVELLGD